MLLIYFPGFLIGYVGHTKRDQGTLSCVVSTPSEDEVVQTETVFNWSKVTSLLKNKLTTSSIDNSFKYVYRNFLSNVCRNNLSSDANVWIHFFF